MWIKLYSLCLVVVAIVAFGCSQIAPPNPYAPKKQNGQNVQDNGGSSSGGSSGGSPGGGSGGKVDPNNNAGGEYSIRLISDSAKTLYSIMGIEKTTSGTDHVKLGTNYSCTDTGTSYYCDIVFVLNSGATKDQRPVGKLAPPDAVAINQDGQDAGGGHPLEIRVDAHQKPDHSLVGRDNSFDMDNASSKDLFEGLKLSADRVTTLPNGDLRKRGIQVNCIKFAKDGSYSCRFYLDWDIGKIDAIDP